MKLMMKNCGTKIFCVLKSTTPKKKQTRTDANLRLKRHCITQMSTNSMRKRGNGHATQESNKQINEIRQKRTEKKNSTSSQSEVKKVLCSDDDSMFIECDRTFLAKTEKVSVIYVNIFQIIEEFQPQKFTLPLNMSRSFDKLYICLSLFNLVRSCRFL